MHLWYFLYFPDTAVDELHLHYNTIDGCIAGSRRPYPDNFQRSITVPQLAETLRLNVHYFFNFSAYIRFFVKVLIETNVNISNEINFSDVY